MYLFLLAYYQPKYAFADFEVGKFGPLNITPEILIRVFIKL
jgi:hypothetical protein